MLCYFCQKRLSKKCKWILNGVFCQDCFAIMSNIRNLYLRKTDYFFKKYKDISTKNHGTNSRCNDKDD